MHSSALCQSSTSFADLRGMKLRVPHPRHALVFVARMGSPGAGCPGASLLGTWEWTSISRGCPTLATYLFLWLGWDRTDFAIASCFVELAFLFFLGRDFTRCGKAHRTCFKKAALCQGTTLVVPKSARKQRALAPEGHSLIG